MNQAHTSVSDEERSHSVVEDKVRQRAFERTVVPKWPRTNGCRCIPEQGVFVGFVAWVVEGVGQAGRLPVTMYRVVLNLGNREGRLRIGNARPQVMGDEGDGCDS